MVLETGHEIPLREQRLEDEKFSEPCALFDPITNAETEPLIKFLVSHTKTRSFVGVSFSHLLGDGASFFMFMQNLAHSIKSDIKFNPVETDRSKLRKFLQANAKTDLFNDTGYAQPRPQDPKSVGIENIFYSHADLNQMKEICKSSGTIVSTNDIIMADLAKKFHESIPLFKYKFIVRCPVDYRKITSLGENFFGNAVRDAVAIFRPSDLQKMGSAVIARHIRESIDAVNQDSVEKSLTALDNFRKEKGVDAFQDLGCPGLLVSNLSKFPISKIDLGSGPPSNFHHASLNPRLALVLPHPNGLMVKFKRPIDN